MYRVKPFFFSYKNAKKTIFSNREFELLANKTYAIVGPSGGGKSTFLKMLKGIIPEFIEGDLEGEILYKNQKLFGDNFEDNLKEIIYLFQNPFSQIIYPETEEEFVFSMENFKYEKTQMDEEATKSDELFSLSQLWGKKTKNLSNGECQKLVLSSLLAINPAVLLMDEPTAFLDPRSREIFYKILKKINKNKLLLIVDHHINEIKELVDHYIYVNENGEVHLIDDFKNIPKIKNNEKIDLTLLPNVGEILLSVKNLNFEYEKNRSLYCNLNLEAKAGEILCIQGENGKGKSTLLKLMSGILKPQSGSIEILQNGRKVRTRHVSKEIGFVFQNPENHFYFDTIKEELIAKEDTKYLINHLLKVFFYSIDLDKSAFLLSEGEKRRLSILMSILSDKKIIFYDEPTFGQDEKSKSSIAEIFSELKQKGYLQIFISHDEDFIKKVSSRVLTLERGVLNETTI